MMIVIIIIIIFIIIIIIIILIIITLHFSIWLQIQSQFECNLEKSRICLRSLKRNFKQTAPIAL